MARRMRMYPWVVLVLISALAGLGWSLSQFQQAREYQQQLAQDVPGKGRSPYVQFANARYYYRHGMTDKALETYVSVAAMDEPALRNAAHFNTGNLYLAEAIKLLETRGISAWDEAGPLVALAKESYQKALRLQPDWSEAKYNYQLALRLAPSTYAMQGPQRYEDENLKQDQDPTGWPAMPGNPRGMP